MDPQTLGAQLWQLSVAGQELKTMGAAHTSACTKVAGVDPTSALSRPAGVGMGANGFATAYTYASSLVQTMLTTNASSLHDSGVALDAGARANYENADADVKARFDAINRGDKTHD